LKRAEWVQLSSPLAERLPGFRRTELHLCIGLIHEDEKRVGEAREALANTEVTRDWMTPVLERCEVLRRTVERDGIAAAQRELEARRAPLVAGLLK
jgi:hypothetical protein